MTNSRGQWLLLAYRLSQMSSTKRNAIWRKLDRLGVARVGDGLVALPPDAPTRERVERVCSEIREYGGSAGLWLAVPLECCQAREIVEGMRAARAREYQRVISRASAVRDAEPERRIRTAGQLGVTLRRIGKRDFFPPADREAARRAVRELTADQR
ncbi:Chromate resistance protein ChrB [Nonomuraea sp. NPDC050691]|uniref:Chromate resistance protein ChrB n=1 Tax=Nonomuraea sp. NPDC050691 TaxID=3155661 RepID=UPI0033D63775